jgi:hypothetical protein
VLSISGAAMHSSVTGNPMMMDTAVHASRIGRIRPPPLGRSSKTVGNRLPASGGLLDDLADYD